MKLSTWRCCHPGCSSTAVGVGTGQGLVALGWAVQTGAGLLCPLHAEGHTALPPLEVAKVATTGALFAIGARALADQAGAGAPNDVVSKVLTRDTKVAKLRKAAGRARAEARRHRRGCERANSDRAWCGLCEYLDDEALKAERAYRAARR